jgi:fumarylacetoacetase
LPLGIVDGRAAVAIGDQCLDLADALDAGLLDVLPAAVRAAVREPRLNKLFALGRGALHSLRHAAFDLLREGQPRATEAAGCLRPLVASQPELPCDVGDYTDFFASPNHARNTFDLFRAGQEFLPNYKHLPIAYHGRSSSIFASPKDFHRPVGQLRPDSRQLPVFGPSRKLDLEVELGFWICQGNAHGTAITMDEAERHIAGLCILNDWSARDVQAWESQPLGPFLSKNFVSAASPWIVTLDALAPFRKAPAARPAEDPAPLPYLHSSSNAQGGAFDVRMETLLQTQAMRESGHAPLVISHANFARDTWWTPAQMIAHHTVAGCNLRAGDLIGTGTISGPEPGTEGCMLELTWGGERPLQLPTGETRAFLADGDEVTIRAWCEGEGRRRIGFGECRGRVLPALET